MRRASLLLFPLLSRAVLFREWVFIYNWKKSAFITSHISRAALSLSERCCWLLALNGRAGMLFRSVSLGARRRALFLAAIKYTLIPARSRSLAPRTFMRNQYSNDVAGFQPLNKLIAPERKTFWAGERAKGEEAGKREIRTSLECPLAKFYWGMVPIFCQWNLWLISLHRWMILKPWF